MFFLSFFFPTVLYDDGVVEYVSTDTDSLYVDAVVKDDGEGTISMNTAGKSGGAENEDVTGDDVPILTVNFRVLSDAGFASHSEALAIFVVDMVNVYSIKFGESVTGQINDERGGGGGLGQLTVAPVAYAGIFAYALSPP